MAMAIAGLAAYNDLGSLPFSVIRTDGGYAVLGPPATDGYTPLANYIEYLIDEIGGTNAAGLVDDTSGNEYDGVPTGVTWVPAANGIRGTWLSLNDGSDYILSTNDGTMVDYVMIGHKISVPELFGFRMYWPGSTSDGSGSKYVATNATSIQVGNDTTSKDIEVGNFFAYTTKQSDAQRGALWRTAFTNFGLPMYAYNNWTWYSNLNTMANAPGYYRDLSHTTNGTTGQPRNMSTVTDGTNVWYSFNGSCAKIFQASNAGFTTNEPWSLAMWVRPSSIANNDSLAAKQRRSTTYAGWWFSVTTGLRMYIQGAGGGNGIIVTDTAAGTLMPNGVWSHVAFTKPANTNPATWKIYINGIVQAVTTAGTGATGDTSAPAIQPTWGSGRTAYYFDGDQMEMYIGEEEWTSNRVFDIYSNTGINN